MPKKQVKKGGETEANTVDVPEKKSFWSGLFGNSNTDKPAEKPAEKPVEKPVEKPEEKPEENSTDTSSVPEPGIFSKLKGLFTTEKTGGSRKNKKTKRLRKRKTKTRRYKSKL